MGPLSRLSTNRRGSVPMSRARARGASGRARRVIALVGSSALFCVAATGCSTHNVAVSRPCFKVTGDKAVAIDNRGAIAMAKIGLTPEGLKNQERCR
jgi:hypothetical protein